MAENKLNLNELGDDEGVDDPDTPTKPTPKTFDSGEQEISYGGLDIHFTTTTPERACELFMWLKEQLNKSPKPNGGSNYLG